MMKPGTLLIAWRGAAAYDVEERRISAEFTRFIIKTGECVVFVHYNRSYGYSTVISSKGVVSVFYNNFDEIISC